MAWSFPRAVQLFRRSSVGFDGQARSSIHSETESNPSTMIFNSEYLHFRPSEPAPPAHCENSHEEPHLLSFKMKAEIANEPCGICLEPYSVVDVTAGQCSHIFHTACLKAWLAKEPSRKQCPLCRNVFRGTIEELSNRDAF